MTISYSRQVHSANDIAEGAYVYLYVQEPIFDADGKWTGEGTPLYVGKGINDRAFDHCKLAERFNAGNKIRPSRWHYKLAKLLRIGIPCGIFLLEEHLTEADAYIWEQLWIGAIGRQIDCTGPLYNLKDGGNGFTSAESRRLYADPEFRAKNLAHISNLTTKLHTDAAHQAKRDAIFARLNADPDFQAKRRIGLAKFFNSDERARRSAYTAKLNTDPEIRAKHRAAMATRSTDPAWQAKHRAHMAKMNADPEFRAKRLAGIAKREANPEFRAKRLAALKRHAQKFAAIAA